MISEGGEKGIYRRGVRAEHLMLLSLAGGIGERRYCGGDGIDLQKARRHLGWWYDADQVEREMARLSDEAARMLRQRWARKIVPVIAGRLLACGSLTGDAPC